MEARPTLPCHPDPGQALARLCFGDKIRLQHKRSGGSSLGSSSDGTARGPVVQLIAVAVGTSDAAATQSPYGFTLILLSPSIC